VAVAPTASVTVAVADRLGERVRGVPARWRIEAAFNRLKDFRRIATRYDKLARNYLASVCLVAALVWWL
jgi:transposase